MGLNKMKAEQKLWCWQCFCNSSPQGWTSSPRPRQAVNSAAQPEALDGIERLSGTDSGHHPQSGPHFIKFYYRDLLFGQHNWRPDHLSQFECLLKHDQVPWIAPSLVDCLECAVLCCVCRACFMLTTFWCLMTLFLLCSCCLLHHHQGYPTMRKLWRRRATIALRTVRNGFLFKYVSPY